ncbi:MAG: PAS domain S-box protein, partial [Deltaproteobacteria bacterium]|nr:PAS domain S-box protein [Deltaproteobacteria bacterium]
MELAVRFLNCQVINLFGSGLSGLGYKEQELIGRPIDLILEKEGAGEKSFLFQGNELHEATKKQVTEGVEATYLTMDGSKIPVLFSSSVMRDRNDTIQGAVCVAKDITERKQVDEELKN